MFHTIPMRKWGNISFPLTGGSRSKSARVITERLANKILGIIINISPNLESMSLHKSLGTIEGLSIDSNNLFSKHL